jgi:hypothetical protein
MDSDVSLGYNGIALDPVQPRAPLAEILCAAISAERKIIAAAHVIRTSADDSRVGGRRVSDVAGDARLCYPHVSMFLPGVDVLRGWTNCSPEQYSAADLQLVVDRSHHYTLAGMTTSLSPALPFSMCSTFLIGG